MLSLNLPVFRFRLGACVAAALGLLATATLADDSRSRDSVEARLKGFAEVPAVSSAPAAASRPASTAPRKA